MDPDIAQLMINMDGQGQRYAHGPVVPMSFVWPGARGGTAAEILAESLTGGNLPAVGASGAWALFRLIDKAKVRNEVSANRLSVSYELGGRGVMLEFSTQGSANPLTSNILQTFSCPKGQTLTMPTITAPNTPANITPAGQLPINPRTGKPLTVSP
jgi:type VI secretion system protein ImpL